MLDLSKVCLPSSIVTEEGRFYINTDFQFWIRFNNKLKEQKLTYDDFDFIYRDFEDIDGTMQRKVPKDKVSGFNELLKFNSPARVLPRDVGHNSSNRMLDYEVDSDLIYSAFYERYGIDLMSDSLHLHWYKFIALLDGLHDTKLNDVFSYRGYNPNDKTKYETYMQRMQQAWGLEEILTEEEQKALDEFDALLK